MHHVIIIGSNGIANRVCHREERITRSLQRSCNAIFLSFQFNALDPVGRSPNGYSLTPRSGGPNVVRACFPRDRGVLSRYVTFD